MKMAMAVLLALLVSGCADHSMCAKAIEPYTNVILPEYEKYVQGDPKLNETEVGISEELKKQRALTKAAALKSATDLKSVVQKLKE